MNIRKPILVLITLLLIPFMVALIANYTTWISTKAKTEITLKLDGWITIGEVTGDYIPDLSLTWKNNPVKNVLKISWSIINSGQKGIGNFEYGPAIACPDNLNIVKVRISDHSPLMKVPKDPELDYYWGSIDVNHVGIFNAGDYIKIDVYITNISRQNISLDSFEQWNLKAKALDLKIKKDLTSAIITEGKKMETWLYWVGAFAGTVSTLVAFVTLFALRKYNVIDDKLFKILCKFK